MATKGAPREKKMSATDKSDTIRYRSECTALVLVMTRSVEMIAMMVDM
jgi:hypothetical protein